MQAVDIYTFFQKRKKKKKKSVLQKSNPLDYSKPGVINSYRVLQHAKETEPKYYGNIRHTFTHIIGTDVKQTGKKKHFKTCESNCWLAGVDKKPKQLVLFYVFKWILRQQNGLKFEVFF